VDRACRLTRPDVVRLGQGLRPVRNFRIDPAVFHAKHVYLVLRLDRHVDPRFGRMEIEVSRAELFSSVGRDRYLVGQYAVLIVEDFQRARVFRFVGVPSFPRVTKIASRLSGVTRT